MVQASPPDKRLPIALGLAWPDRVPGVAAPCDWTAATAWEFFPLDADAFPAVDIARRAGRFARTAPAVFNAANEVCVDAFVARRLSFLEIVDTVEMVVDEHVADPAVATAALSLDAVRSADAWARARAAELVEAAGEGRRE
jgi:1-deoxy-D-xylulose-5-phosphate reductoisomerase